MTTTTKPRLRFGYNDGLPEGYDGPAWGARLIFPSGLVHDRQDTVHFGDWPKAVAEGQMDALHAWLNGDGAFKGERALAKALDAARTCGLRQDEQREVVLYEDAYGRIVANPNSSHGYLYVVAYRR